jgi:5-oxoprolinase (ATP-hydrolysing) subunit A
VAIDLNADLGEREDALEQDVRILESVTSANVACGFHAGTVETMGTVCEQALRMEVTVGAHVSYRDREHFGRRDIEVGPERLTDDVIEQLAVLAGVTRELGGTVSYVKPHGALYNRCVRDPEYANAVVQAILTFDSSLRVMCLPGSALNEIAGERGIEPVGEGFADRGYLPNGELIPRGHPGAVLDLEESVAQALDLASGFVMTENLAKIQLRIRSLCFHSDTPGAPALARSLRGALETAGIELRAFA